MLIPATKSEHVNSAAAEVKDFEMQYQEGLITANEKYNKAVDVWSRCVDRVASDMMKCISSSMHKPNWNEAGCSHINSIYMMAHSGARGSPAQIKQLAGMRGLMSKPSGEIIETPIISNFREGLTVLEYFNSTHGARKGLSDTALKTANSGYLTRRLVDVAQDFVIKEHDCGTKEGIVLRQVVESGEVVVKISELVLGRIAVSDIRDPISDELIISAGEMFDESKVEKIDVAGIDAVKVRSVLMCKLVRGSCAKCYGRDLAIGSLVSVGEAVGVISAQSIGEPGTQLTMRTFHIGGAATGGGEVSSVMAINEGVVTLVNSNVVVNRRGENILMSRSCEILLHNLRGTEIARYNIPYGSRLHVSEGSKVAKGEKLADWDPYTIPILAEKSGTASYKDLIDSVSVNEVMDDVTGVVSKVIIDWRHHSQGMDIKPSILLLGEDGAVLSLSNGLDACYPMTVGAILNVKDGQSVHAGDVLTRIPRKSARTKDITGGLPRVADLFEARKPRDHAIISGMDGIVEFGKDYKSKQRVIIRSKTNPDDYIEYLLPKGKYTLVAEGGYIRKGDLLIDGDPDPQDILNVMGVEAAAHYITHEIQSVYRLQGVKIDNKHIEIVLKQMLQKVEIVESGDTMFLAGEQIDKEDYYQLLERLEKENKTPPTVVSVLQGITRASLHTKSFISAASFQETTRVLTEAAINAKTDPLLGLKENVLVGRLIPGGTGYYNNIFRKMANVTNNDLSDINQ